MRSDLLPLLGRLGRRDLWRGELQGGGLFGVQPWLGRERWDGTVFDPWRTCPSGDDEVWEKDGREMGARTDAERYGGLLFFDRLVEQAHLAVYLSRVRMSGYTRTAGRHAHRFVCCLRDIDLLLSGPDGLFGRLGNVLEERTRRLSGLWLECLGRARGRVNMCVFGTVDLHGIWRRAILFTTHMVYVVRDRSSSLCVVRVASSLSRRQALSQLNVPPNGCQEVCMENCTKPACQRHQQRGDCDAYPRSERPTRESA